MSELRHDPAFLEALRYYLYQKKWRPADLHRATGRLVAKSAISAWMNKKSRPTLIAVHHVAEAFGVTVADYWTTGQQIVDEQERRRRAEEREREHREIELTADLDVLAAKLRTLSRQSLEQLRAVIDAALRNENGGDGDDGPEDPGDVDVDVR
jgi:transcriptional regulator with XRE-family HTH domain